MSQTTVDDEKVRALVAKMDAQVAELKRILSSTPRSSSPIKEPSQVHLLAALEFSPQGDLRLVQRHERLDLKRYS